MNNNHKYLIFFILAILLALGVIISPPNIIPRIIHNLTQRFSGKPKLKVKFINQYPRFDSFLDIAVVMEVLEEKYYVVTVREGNDYDVIVDGVWGVKDEKGNFVKDSRLNDNPKAVKLFFTSEAYLANLNNYDLTLGFDNINNDKYLRIPLYYYYFTNRLNLNYNRGKCNPNKPVFACYLYSNYGEINPVNNLYYDGVEKRTKLFHLLSLYKFVLSGGKHLNNNSNIRIPLENTIEWLGQCKFVIAYENQSHDGYITEKLFRAWFAGSMPIYWGDKSVAADINTNALIYANDFTNENDLIEYIKKVDNDDELYCKIWNQQLLKSSDKEYEVIKNELRIKLNKILNEKLKVK